MKTTLSLAVALVALSPPAWAGSRGTGYRAAIMKGVGHYLMLEQSEAFNALLAEALRDLARSGGRR